MSLEPKWAKPATIIGLELALRQAFHQGAITSGEYVEFAERIAQLEKMK